MIEEELDLEGMSEADLERGPNIPAGWYHSEIGKVDEETDSSPCVVFQFRILEGTVKGQTNRIQFDRLYRTEKTKQRRGLFAKRLGLIGGSDLGTRKVIDWSDAQGKQCVIEIIEEEFTPEGGSTRKKSKLAFDGIYAVDDARVSQVPKSADALALAGIVLPPPAPAVSQGTTPPAANGANGAASGAGAGAGSAKPSATPAKKEPAMAGPPTIDI